MAFEYLYDPKDSLIRIVCHDVVSIDDRIQCVRRMLDDPALPGKAPILINVHEVSNSPDPGEFRLIGALIERLRLRFGGRVGIVNQQVGHVTASHLIAMSVAGEYRNVQVFPSETAAREWLSSETV